MKFFRWLRQFRRKIYDKEENRDFIGTDKFGNKYYQYFSHYGLPTRREVRIRILTSDSRGGLRQTSDFRRHGIFLVA